MGRKPLNESAKEIVLRIRLTESERAELDTAADAADKPTSSWARDELLRLARRKRSKPQPAGKRKPKSK